MHNAPKHPTKECKGYLHNFSHPTEAIAKILRVEKLGFETLTPELFGAKAKLLVFTPGCKDCEAMARREMQRRLLLRPDEHKLYPEWIERLRQKDGGTINIER